MQEIWKFENLKGLVGRETELTVWFQDLFNLYGKEMGIFLSYYFHKEGAVVENVRLIPPDSDLTEMNGTISVSFQLIHFNACLNIHETNSAQLLLFYEISANGTDLTLTGPYWPEREPDEI